MSRKSLYILILVVTLALNGCWVSRLAVNSIGDSIFDTPQKVTKLNNPLLDSVRISVLWAGHSSSLVQICGESYNPSHFRYKQDLVNYHIYNNMNSK